MAKQSMDRVLAMYTVLSNINEILARTESREKLLEGICGTMAESAGYDLVWTGFLNRENKNMDITTSAGEDKSFLEGLTSIEKDILFGPAVMAVQAGRKSVCREAANSNQSTPWRELMKRVGFTVSGVFPVSIEGVSSGAIAVYAKDPGL